MFLFTAFNLTVVIKHSKIKFGLLYTFLSRTHTLLFCQIEFLFFFMYTNLFIYFWLHWVFLAAHRLSLVAVSGGYSFLRCAGFSLPWPLLLRSMGSTCAGFSSCVMWTQQLWLAGSRAQAQQLWRMGLVAPRYVGSSWTRARTRVPCIGRQILNHCATGEVRIPFLSMGVQQLKSGVGREMCLLQTFLYFLNLNFVTLLLYAKLKTDQQNLPK